MTVIVIAGIDGNDLVFRLAADNCTLSKLYRLRGKAHQINSNPYLVYGTAAARWMGMKKYTQNLVVATMSSGNLTDAKPHKA